MRILLSLASTSLLIASASAQVFKDEFNYPNGPAVPGWTPQTGTWQVQNGRLSPTSGSLWAYITKDGLSATRSVIDGEFFFVGSGVQFAGLTSRHPGGGASSNLLMVKIQNNGGVADFDRVFQYEQPGGSNYADIPGGTQSAYCRMVTLDNEFWMETDADKDGVYELVMAPKPITLALGGTLVGMDGYQTSEMDNFEFFDAVLLPQPNATPRIGMNYDMRLYTPSPNTVWIGGLALGNSGFPLGNRMMPLSPDFLAVGTFANPAWGMVGVTDGNGDDAPSIPIPPYPFIVGLTVYASAITLDPTMPLGVGNISNEQAFVIQL